MPCSVLGTAANKSFYVMELFSFKGLKVYSESNTTVILPYIQNVNMWLTHELTPAQASIHTLSVQ